MLVQGFLDIWAVCALYRDVCQLLSSRSARVAELSRSNTHVRNSCLALSLLCVVLVLAVGGGAGSGNSGTIAAGNFGLPIEVATYTIRITFFVRGVIGLVIIYTLMMLIKVGMSIYQVNSIC